MTPAQIREARQSLGLTQAQLAAVLGYPSVARVSELERGIRNAGPAVVILLRVYLSGYRPDDWPIDTTS